MSLDIVYFPALIEFQYTYSNDSGASYTDNIPENLRQWTGLGLKTMNPLLLSVCRIGTLKGILSSMDIIHTIYSL